MIKNTRIATEEEKSSIIHYIAEQTYPPKKSYFVSTTQDKNAIYELWQKASFIIIEVQDLDSKIVVVNNIATNKGDILNIVSAYYLLMSDNTVLDLGD